MSKEVQNYKPKSGHKLTFIIMSLIGVFLFMVPLPFINDDGYRAFNIPLGFAINWLGGFINQVPFGDYGLLFLLAAIAITVSFLGSVLAYTVKPGFIMNNEKLKKLFQCGIVYLVSKAIGFALVWMVFFDIGPAVILDQWDGAGLMMSLIAGSTGLMAIFIVLGIAIPILTDFGLMEFLGILIRKAVRFLFTLPGRSSIDLLGSWFSSSAASVIITRNQHEKGYYTGREAAAICVNFTLVSLPFTFVVANFIDVTGSFALFYLTICVVSIILAVIFPRIWPLSRIKDEYLPEVGKQIDEEVPQKTSMFSWAVKLASKRASETTPVSVIKSGLSNWLSIFMDLIPVILAWGTIALVINNTTPIFEWISWPFGQYMNLLQVPYAMEYAPATVVGFVDMFIPAVMLGTTAPFETRFIIGALSIVQIIYLAETGILILKSRIPLNILHLAILFIMRTIVALPLIVLMHWLLFSVF
ncbi:MAG: YjiH family protein [Defluviitaleaceae bacterium]|nr:YjiH family protein [Defluviitaleaceae bacterium]